MSLSKVKMQKVEKKEDNNNDGDKEAAELPPTEEATKGILTLK